MYFGFALIALLETRLKLCDQHKIPAVVLGGRIFRG